MMVHATATISKCYHLLNPKLPQVSSSETLFSLFSLKSHQHSTLSLLQNCNTWKQFKEIHARAIVSGQTQDQTTARKIIEICIASKLRHLNYAKLIFREIQNPDVIIWNTLIRGFSDSEMPQVAISLYNELVSSETLRPDNYTFPFVIRACANLYAIRKGKEIHGFISKMGFQSYCHMMSSLLNMYSGFREINSARQVFDEFTDKDLVFWNSMISGYVKCGRYLDALNLLKDLESRCVRPNEVTIIHLISACTLSRDLEMGRYIHNYAVNSGCINTMSMKLGSSLIDMYAKCGCLESSRELFHRMPQRNTIVWNSMISGYSRMGLFTESMSLFREMQSLNVNPDEFTVSTVLSACAGIGALSLGKWVHRFIEKNKIWDIFIGTALIDMYAKCGSVADSRNVFNKMPEKNLTTWNAMMSGYSMHGHAREAIVVFMAMIDASIEPDSITFVAVLSACAHAGLVEDGFRFFDSMVKDYGIKPKIEHYGCIVDLLGRSGRLKEAMIFIERMPFQPNIIIWGSLLNACSVHGNAEIGKRVADHLLRLNEMDSGVYILVSNILASARRFEDVKKVREMMREKGYRKAPGCSLIEIGDIVYEFAVADRANPQSEEIYMVLDELTRESEMAGYVPLLRTDWEY